MSDEGVDIPMSQPDYEGSIEKLSVQTGSRVKIPEEWLEYHGLQEGDDVALVCKDDGVKIVEWSRENLKKL